MWSSAAIAYLLKGLTCWAFSRAATYNNFDNRLVGLLFFRLIGLKKIILLTKYTLFHILHNVLQTNRML